MDPTDPMLAGIFDSIHVRARDAQREVTALDLIVRDPRRSSSSSDVERNGPIVHHVYVCTAESNARICRFLGTF